MSGPTPPEKIEQIKKLVSEGKGRNDIVRITGVGAGTVTKIVKTAGLKFDTGATEEAVKVRSLRLANLRQELAEELLLNANIHARAGRSEYEQTALGATLGGGSDWYTINLPVPPARDRKDLMSAASIAANAAIKLIDFDRGTASSDTAASMVGSLVEKLATIRAAETRE